jgi:hypothetical protein
MLESRIKKLEREPKENSVTETDNIVDKLTNDLRTPVIEDLMHDLGAYLAQINNIVGRYENVNLHSAARMAQQCHKLIAFELEKKKTQ